MPISDAGTEAEADFVCAVAPLPDFRRIADVCCGMGRHARALANRGYLVTAIDRDAGALAKARELSGSPRYINVDLRDYSPEPCEYDAIAIMGQSFGHFDAATNEAVLRRLALGLRQHGRLVLDLWAANFFHAHEGAHEFQVPAGTVHELKRVEENRLFVNLIYPSGEHEDFEWQLFTPEAIDSVARRVGLSLKLSCTDFDGSTAPSPSNPRIQFVLDRV
ncbi:MAG: class I SAM-dependent methyltransferase [Chthoniobacterales bacterium]